MFNRKSFTIYTKGLTHHNCFLQYKVVSPVTGLYNLTKLEAAQRIKYKLKELSMVIYHGKRNVTLDGKINSI
jgi:hypothetical protein